MKVKFLPLYLEEDIPDNELGELIRTRNESILELEGYQNDLEEKLEEAKGQIIQAAKLSTVGEFTSSIMHDRNVSLT